MNRFIAFKWTTVNRSLYANDGKPLGTITNDGTYGSPSFRIFDEPFLIFQKKKLNNTNIKLIIKVKINK